MKLQTRLDSRRRLSDARVLGGGDGAGCAHPDDVMVPAIANRVIRKVAAEWLPAVQWQQVSVLDSRTSRACQDHALKEWDSQFRPIEHHLPFQDWTARHWNCQWVIVPVAGALNEIRI